MHPTMSQLYPSLNFEYQFRKLLGTPSNQPILPKALSNAPAHLAIVSDIYRDDHNYLTTINSQTIMAANRHKHIMPFFLTLLPTANKRQRTEQQKETPNKDSG
jgi:hypothetical protein